ncbi:sensor histidine kinase [Nonomuraea cavernae]|uniref:sensor histidine kinase n=1 Tax=Nonomuraea cavernae TaxID=2045107 RepID=UPI0027DEEB00|nr:sensor histidine kinase [Nonomuraea cavernae]
MTAVVLRRLAGVLAGTLTGAAALALLLLAWPWRSGWAPRLAAVERARSSAWLGHHLPDGVPGAGYVALRGLIGVLGGYVALVLTFTGLLFASGGLWAMTYGQSSPVSLNLPGVRLTTESWAVGLTCAVVMLALAVAWCRLVAGAERRLAVRFLGPGPEEVMRRRIAELTSTRSGIVRAVDDERRRIERDLHDGVQQRGVALAMLLGRARHSPGAAAELVDQAYLESRQLLDELRGVAWRIYPTALDELGLRAALEGVAERSGVPVTVHYGLAGRPVSEVETALYFVAREAITNAVKHAEARDILVVLEEDEREVRVTISDDGRGGADPAGGGLSGLARRVLALDGGFEVGSATGGGTRVRAWLPKQAPCG